ncbi:hypothetical protein [Albidovulum sp.]|uniref:hypothetical protein n=1 Tax=Albidovulum sp. TaxID=1872424 RepID=UPI001D8A5B86|nr:hypothetical protein [Paracoccaceae bacterium]MCC0046449.1 hypothetical protein [Defluviimonas sp.]HPE24526.1 hypothetical protein [Albidovulum sp.]MCP5323917.1 hypothetical protein [Paracoccaceae bacterium]MCP5356250.1 hypothetical protein [Paracoccaceae bacterium]
MCAENSAAATKSPSVRAGDRILAIDCLPTLATSIEAIGFGPLVHARHDHLDARLLAKVMPDLIVAPLLAPGFDAIELSETLHRLGFRGRFVVFAPSLPNARTVTAELRAHCPALAIDLIQIDAP